MVKSLSRVAVVAGAVTCLSPACGGSAPSSGKPPDAGRVPSAEDLRRLQQRTSGPIFWLGGSFMGARLSTAELTSRPSPSVSLSYGPATCDGDSGCTYELEVHTKSRRRPYDHEHSCWQRLDGGAWLDWCEGYESGVLYTGSSRVDLFSVNATPEEVAREVRPLPREGRSTLPTARRFTCREARELPRSFLQSLPDALQPHRC